MMLNADQCYQALVARDPRFDGRFFVAVRSTHIYCRPICRVRVPLRRNCLFFAHAAAAEAAGFRPCKRCRPELAPGSSSMEANSSLARRIAWQIGQDYLAEHSLEELAGSLGVSDRHAREVFRHEFGVSPVEFWQTQRLLLAKRLLTDSNISITDVALASGFKSLRRFNAVFKMRYRMPPSELRRQLSRSAPKEFAQVRFRLHYRPPLDWKRLIAFFSARAIEGVELVRESRYLRTVRIIRRQQTFPGIIEVDHDAAEHALRVRLSASLMPVCAVVLERVKRLFDLHAEPAVIAAALGEVASSRPGLRVPGSLDGFELAVRAILGQQISVPGARTIAGRLAARFGELIEDPAPGLKQLFPGPDQVANQSVEDILKIGITRKRAETLLCLARAMASGQIVLEPGQPVEKTLALLKSIPGIGEWTAQYIAMRALAWPDAFPASDLGIRKALGEENPAKVMQLAEPWRPWRSYAALHLWATLERNNDNDLHHL